MDVNDAAAQGQSGFGGGRGEPFKFEVTGL